ncbi:hypothetical protein COLO4_19704 [Corchorus olitorius]|uniref:Uncharacterized protein n=1 Tax=Corchorus olitorius TaxID=93759 RepID=A0A1R3J408_9ROSI|nr:hypothetical protein COLO4_19704 [Corchorus olitorius]
MLSSSKSSPATLSKNQSGHYLLFTWVMLLPPAFLTAFGFNFITTHPGSGNVNNRITSGNEWTSKVTAGDISLGLPAAEAAALSIGYFLADTPVSDVRPVIKESSKYGGSCFGIDTMIF